MLAYRKSHFGHLFGILNFNESIYTFSVYLSFRMHIFYWGCYRNTVAYRNSHFGYLFRILDLNERIYKLLVNLERKVCVVSISIFDLSLSFVTLVLF